MVAVAARGLSLSSRAATAGSHGLGELRWSPAFPTRRTGMPSPASRERRQQSDQVDTAVRPSGSARLGNSIRWASVASAAPPAASHCLSSSCLANQRAAHTSTPSTTYSLDAARTAKTEKRSLICWSRMLAWEHCKRSRIEFDRVRVRWMELGRAGWDGIGNVWTRIGSSEMERGHRMG